MKIRNILYATLILCSSCTDWLDITPKDIVVEEEMYSHYEGYRNALNGIYKQMASTDMYGKEMSWGFVDVLGQCYMSGYGGLGSYHPYVKAMDLQYEDKEVKPYIKSMWEKAYNSIANCNNILKRIDEVDSTFFPMGEAERLMIKGEALALRAYLHFDMLRLFAPAPVVDDKKDYIPYYKSYPSYGESRQPVAAVLDQAIKDLVEARDYLARFDTLASEYSSERLGIDYRFSTKGNEEVLPEDIFYAFRGYRMSYPTILALLARVYNYIGDHGLAKVYATEVIEMKSTRWKTQLFSFTSKDKVREGNRKMTFDLICALSSPLLYTNYLPYVNSEPANSDACLVINGGKSIYDDAADYRSTVLLSPLKYQWVSNRNISPEVTNEEIKDMIPIIRLSEMYYILAESYAAESNWVKAAEAIDQVRMGRDCQGGVVGTRINDFDSFKTELLNEVKREFISEGQTFFYYKKFNTKLFKSMKEEASILPLPDEENIN